MHNRIVLFCTLLFSVLLQPTLAQQVNQKTIDSLTLALAQDEDFIAFNLETIRHGEKVVEKNLTKAESKAFTKQQMARLENIGKRFPEISQLPEDLRSEVRQKARQVVQITHQEEIDQIQQKSKQ